MKVTAKEIEVLKAIANSEYQDGENPVDHDVWLDYIVDSKSRGGVLTSLMAKGLVRAFITKEYIDSHNKAIGTLSTVAITQAGFDALNG
jgi:hypothetical protein